jgi:hypothetical protein
MKLSKLSGALATAGLIVTVYAVWLSYRFERGSFSTQQSGELAFQRYSYVWAVGTFLSFCGYLGIAVALDCRTAVQRGGTALWATFALLLLVFVIPIVSKEDWTGAAFLMLLFLIFGYGAILLAVGLLRLACARLRSR